MADPPADHDKLIAAAAQVADGRGVDWTRQAEGLSPGVAQRLQEIEALAGIFARDARLGARLGQAPRYFSRLVLREAIGPSRGGTLHRAFDPALDREVLLKCFPPGTAASESILRRARALTRVEHPRFIRVHGVAEQEGEIGVWCAAIDGESLPEALSAAPRFDVETLIELLTALAGAVDAVHERGIAHGAIEADQVFRVVDGAWALSGLGAVAAAFAVDGRNHAAEPRPRDLRDDASALCLLVARVALGDLAAEASSVTTRLASEREDLPEDLTRLLLRGITAPADGAFNNARDVLEALRAVRRPRGGLSAVTSWWRRLTTRD